MIPTFHSDDLEVRGRKERREWERKEGREREKERIRELAKGNGAKMKRREEERVGKKMRQRWKRGNTEVKWKREKEEILYRGEGKRKRQWVGEYGKGQELD